MSPETRTNTTGAPRRAAAPPPTLDHARGAAAPRARLRLADARRGLFREPYCVTLYGVEGIGKTSFGAAAPAPLVIGVERGSAEIGNVQRLEPETFDDVLGLLEQLRTEDHAFRSVVLDTLDWLEPIVHAATCARSNKPTIAAFGYGAGYVEALSEWRQLLAALDAIKARGLNVILLAHAVCRTFKNPDATQGDYDRYQLKLHDKAAALVKEWSKALLFATYERATVERNGRDKAIDTGRRVIYTRGAGAYEAKNRLWLPEELRLGWAPFARAAEAGEQLRARWYAALEQTSEQRAAAAREAVEAANYEPNAIESVIATLTQ